MIGITVISFSPVKKGKYALEKDDCREKNKTKNNVEMKKKRRNCKLVLLNKD